MTNGAETSRPRGPPQTEAASEQGRHPVWAKLPIEHVENGQYYNEAPNHRVIIGRVRTPMREMILHTDLAALIPPPDFTITCVRHVERADGEHDVFTAICGFAMTRAIGLSMRGLVPMYTAYVGGRSVLHKTGK